MSDLEVSVVIPTYNRADVVSTTLQRLLQQDLPSDRYEVLVCDNSSDETPDRVRQLASTTAVRVQLLSGTDRLPAVKRNHGLRAARGRIVVFMNDDVWVRPDFLSQHVAEHGRRRTPAAVLGHVEQSPMMPQTPFAQWYRPFAYHEIDNAMGRPLSYRYSWSMNLSFPRKTMLARNLLFHEDWAYIGHEDVELGWRWTGAGFPIVYCPQAWGEHYHPHGLESACRLQDSIGRGLRDLESLVPDAALLERYGVFSWHNSSRSIVRGLARRALFNAVTVPLAQQWLGDAGRQSRLASWLYWKVLLHHTNRGYRGEPARSPMPTPVLSVAGAPWS